MFDAAVAAADPMRVLTPHLPPAPRGRLIVIGAGKASARMAEAVAAHYGALGVACGGLVITRYGYERPAGGIEIASAAHPVPDAAGVAATQRMLALGQGLTADDTVVALMSGGGSALLCAPVPGLTLADKQALNAALLASGARISEMNVVRKQVSAVKGGRLAAAFAPARLLTLLISDVPGDDPSEIASGPTVGSDATPQEALGILDRYRIDLPHIRAAIAAAPPPVRPGDARLAHATTRIVAAPAASLAAAAEVARAAGWEARILGDALEGEARDLGQAQAERALAIARAMTPGARPVALLSGGEVTVTRRGDGIGGPNAEFALAAAIALRGAADIHLIACDTDGVDGAAEVAGAMASGATVARAEALGLSAAEALARNDAHRFFAALGDQVVTGPTLTNVNDFRVIVVMPPGGQAPPGAAS